jgi:hypothetical protein
VDVRHGLAVLKGAKVSGWHPGVVCEKHAEECEFHRTWGAGTRRNCPPLAGHELVNLAPGKGVRRHRREGVIRLFGTGGT